MTTDSRNSEHVDGKRLNDDKINCVVDYSTVALVSMRFVISMTIQYLMCTLRE